MPIAQYIKIPVILCVFALLLVATPAASAPEALNSLKVGDSVPELVFEDINGAKATTSIYDSRIQVITFADRSSSDHLMEWLLEVGPEVMVRYPSLKMAYIGFADLQAVPSIFSGVVYPALKIIHSRSETTLAEAFEAQGVPFTNDVIGYHLIPDWEGKYLNRFGLKDAETFHCFIVRNKKVVGYFDGKTPRIGARYVALIEKLMKESAPTKAVELATTK